MNWKALISLLVVGFIAYLLYNMLQTSEDKKTSDQTTDQTKALPFWNPPSTYWLGQNPDNMPVLRPIINLTPELPAHAYTPPYQPSTALPKNIS